ncbi:MAG: hypothetical protein PUC67_08215, partial [Coriobacteriaceae bacterium]|nr:hypothetical protein [Coriobacteriaceae bacterium]
SCPTRTTFLTCSVAGAAIETTNPSGYRSDRYDMQKLATYNLAYFSCLNIEIAPSWDANTVSFEESVA